MRVTMIGAGYVGLVSGACFADFGHQVTCIDKDVAKIAALNHGEIPIFEPGLAELVESNVRQGRLEFAAETSRVSEADVVFIAVGTPSRRGDGHADLSFVYQAVREIAPLLSGAAVVITKSTVPVGTGDEIEIILRERRPDADIQVASNPEFLREGAAIQDFKHPDRIVVGSDDDNARKVLAEIYRPLYLNTLPMPSSPPRSPLSTRWPIYASRSAPTCRRLRAPWGSTIASARSFCTPGPVSAAPASPRTRAH